MFVDIPEDIVNTERHNAPCRQFTVVLKGRLLVEARGESRVFGPGDIALMEDTTGEGHVTTVLEAPARVLFVPLA